MGMICVVEFRMMGGSEAVIEEGLLISFRNKFLARAAAVLPTFPCR